MNKAQLYTACLSSYSFITFYGNGVCMPKPIHRSRYSIVSMAQHTEATHTRIDLDKAHSLIVTMLLLIRRRRKKKLSM